MSVSGRLQRVLILAVTAWLVAVGAAGASTLNLRQAPAAPGTHHGPGLRASVPSQAALSEALEQETGLAPSQVDAQDVCTAHAPGEARCLAQVIVSRSSHRLVHPHPQRHATLGRVGPESHAAAVASPMAGTTAGAASPPSAGTPAYLQQAYDLTYLSSTAGGSDTVAIVDAGDDPTAESDLATYRAQWGLPACTTANGCFSKVNQSGQSSPLPGQVSGWREEESLDLDAVSALCPKCHILFVVTNSAYTSDLDAGVSTAQSLGAKQISASWGAGSTSPYGSAFPGANLLAATGDSGYTGTGYGMYPASFPGVTAVGGTSLSAASSSSSARGFSEAAWALNNGWGGGSGCNNSEAKPSWQTDTGCTGRSYSDVSADGDPNTGLIVYDQPDGGWLLIGGTSLATPLTAAYEAVTGLSVTNGQWAYTDSSLLNDPVSGSTGSCPTAYSYICNAQTGYDGPTGAGSISGDITTGAPGIGGPAVGGGSNNTYASGVAGTTANLVGGVYPNGLDTHYWWQYGTTTAYGSSTASVDAGSSATPVPAPAQLTGLNTVTTYHYRLVASNSAGTTYGYDYTFTTASAGAVPPVNTSAPTISGTAMQGASLTATAGNWNPGNSTFAYQWQRSADSGNTWSNISGATGSSYQIAGSDLDDELRVIVTATDSYGSTPATSSAVGPVASGAPVNSAYPVISGTAQQGQTLSVSTGSWSPAATGYRYQWQQSTDGTTWNTIAGATSATYTPGTGDLNAQLRAVVTATNSYGVGIATATVGPVSSGAPVNTVAPSISGNAAQGYILSVISTWSPAGTSYAYQWQQSTDGGTTWTNITNATGSTYSLGAGDVGHKIRVRQTATNPYGQAAATSPAVGPIANSEPTPQSPPQVSGQNQRTDVLSATTGTWTGPNLVYSYQWQESSDGTSWTDIQGATGSSHTLQAADEGFELRVVVSASNFVGAVSSPSAATPVIAPNPPSNTAAPTLSGVARRGHQLTAAAGTWIGPDNAYSYQWQEDFGEGYVDIAGATTTSYTPLASDEGDTLRVVVTATNPDASIVQASSPTAVVTGDIPVNDAAPQISGSVQRGSSITTSTGTWEGANNTYGYQWQHSTDGGVTWTNVTGQTGAAYAIGVGDEGSRLRVLVTATNPDGTATQASSATTTVQSAPPVNTAVPTITGTAQRGQTLTATQGTWSGLNNTYALQWQRSADGGTNWTDINNATGASYTLAVADEGDIVRIKVTATNPDTTVTAASQASATVTASAPVNTSVPTLSGAAQRGVTLTAQAGSWSGTGNGYAVQWQHSTDGGTTWTDISGATSWTYPLAVSDEGAKLRAKVIASNPDGTVAATTAATATVAAALPVATTPPSVTGSTVRGSALSSSAGVWSGVGNSYAYQWQRSANSGTSWTNVTGATGSSYTITTADEGDTLRVQLTATNADGAVTASSTATATVTAAPPVATTQPSLPGTAQRGVALTLNAGAWSGVANTYSYAWQRSTNGGTSWTTITGATDRSYTPVVADEGDKLRAQVIATNADATVTATTGATTAVTAAPPVNSVVPTIYGTATRGMGLQVSDGTWSGIGNVYSYQWQRSADGITWHPIAGATSTTYIVSLADEGNELRAQVTAVNDDATVSAVSAATATIPSAPPVNGGAPTISGAAQRGTMLTSTPGQWSGPSLSYTYQWQRSANSGSSWANIAGATGQSYKLATADEGDTVRLQVTAANDDGTITASSAASSTVTSSPPANVTAPSVSGSAVRAATLTAVLGTWSGASNTPSYQWQRSSDGTSWTSIGGATDSSYSPQAVDEGQQLRVVVTESNPDGSVSVPTAATSTVAAAPPVSSTSPALQGTAKRTQPITASTGGWSGAGNSFAYQWQRSPDGSTWSNITGATLTSYTPVASDEGQRLRFVVTATNPDGSVAASSPPSSPVLGAPPVASAAPAISGADRLGVTVTASNGAWAPGDVTYAYQWQRGTTQSGYTNISGATSNSYTLVSADVSQTVRVQVSATNSDGTATATSAPTATVLQAPVNQVAPVAPSGTLMDSYTLTADRGTWDTASSYSYIWLRCPAGANAVSSACTTVGSGVTYTLGTADIGSTMAVRVSATSSGGTTTVASPVTATVVGRALSNTAAPSISGTPYPPNILHANPGTWSVPLTGIHYTWYRCDADGTSNCVAVTVDDVNYQLTSTDIGHTMVLAASASSPGRTASASSIPVTVQNAPTPRPTAQPTITGTAQRGQTLTASAGSWTNSPTGYAYQWQRCDGTGQNCQAIAGATGASYTLIKADEGDEITVTVTATDGAGSGTSSAPPTAAVAQALPVNVQRPALHDSTPEQGSVETVSGATWTTTPDTTYAVSWERCDSSGQHCATISGAGTAYTPGAADVGNTLVGVITATNPDGSVQATTPVSAVIEPAAPRWKTLPTFSASDAKVGTTVTVTAGSWSGPAVSTDAIVLMRCTNVCVADSSAHTYTIGSADTGAILRVRETATNSGGSTVVWSASYLGPVLSANAGSAVLGGAAVTLRNSNGVSLATASLQTGGVSADTVRAAAARRAVRRVRRVTIERAHGLHGKLRAWACAATPGRSGGAGPCTRKVTFSAVGRLTLPRALTGRVRIVVVRR